MASTRWMAVGASTALAAGDAGREAAERAAEHGPAAKLAIAFCSAGDDAAEVARGIRAALPQVPLIGCSTASGPADADGVPRRVVVAVVGGEGLSAATAAGRSASARPGQAGVEVASCLQRAGRLPHRALVVLADRLPREQDPGALSVACANGGGAPVVGGCSGDPRAQRRTVQLIGDEVLSDALVGAALASEAPIGIGMRHGFGKLAEPMLVSASDGHRVFRLDGRPALDVYLERLGAPGGAADDPAALGRLAEMHPLGVSRRQGQERLVPVEGRGLDRGSLDLGAAVAEGTLVWLMAADAASVLDAAEAACLDALAPLGGREPRGLLAFGGVARQAVLGDDGIAAERRLVAEQARGAPVARLATHGEIGCIRGQGGLQSHALAVLALG